jgi:glycosyltransferase involved in cell wall biosynthesis
VDAGSVILGKMATRPPLTAIVITLNEEANVTRCLKSLEWADERLVVDSGSTDRTLALAESSGARALVHAWEGYGQQKNWAMQQARHDWVMFVDADEEVTPALATEVQSFLTAQGKVNGQQYWGGEAPRKTWFLGRWIMHGGWYPNRLVRLANRRKASWTEPSVHESLSVDGAVYRFASDLNHFTFKNVGEQVQTNIRFARLGAKVAAARGERGSLLRIITKPVGKFFETYFWKRGFLDGFPGFVISVNAAHSIFMKYVELRLEKDSPDR